MAEVGRRLRSGVYRLSALRNSPARSVCAGESLGPLPVSCSSTTGQIKQDLTAGATRRRRAKVSRVRSESQQEHGTVCCSASLELDSPPFIGFIQTSDSLHEYQSALYLTASLQPVFQGRRTPWTRGDVCIHPDILRSSQQLRAFCTVVFILGEHSGRHLRLLPDSRRAYTNSRSYSSSKDAPPLYRSRTAYYDILKVTPAATQSQIKTAYYKQSFIYHPDKNPGNKEANQAFSEISEAYTVLGNISLRRKYDRGILSQSDLQSAGRPSSKETTSRSTGSSQQQQQQYRARRFSQDRGKTMFDFDAFYQAHYGEQLQREKDLRARRQRMEEMQKEKLQKWRQDKMLELTVVVVLGMAGLIFINISQP